MQPPMMACAILNIPVKSTDVINIGKSRVAYLDLASLGILNLEQTTGNKFYIHMPYLWDILQDTFDDGSYTGIKMERINIAVGD